MNTTLLVTPDWLAANLDNPAVRVVDVRWYLMEHDRGRADYLEAHIPGAVYMDIDHDLAEPPAVGHGRHPLPTPEHFAAVASNAGIGPETHVVVYDASGGIFATRVWWLLRYFGHEHVSLLDGGWIEWLARGYPTQSGDVQAAPATFTPSPHPEMVLDGDDVEQLRHDQGTLLLDARAPERYEGRVEPMDSRAGHIPSARSAHFAANLQEDGTLKSAEALKSRYEDLGAAQAERIICYCGSGITATHDIFALELAGYPGALLYEGSWSDWSSNPNREIATGPKPQ